VWGLVGPDGKEYDRACHMDCCATAFNCEVCTAQLADVGGAEGNPKGQALRDHLITTGPGVDQSGWTAPVGEES
jgi:hypothetical protein